MNNKLILSAIFVLLTSILNYSFGQDAYSKVNLASPTAASIGKFGDIPVNNHTGIPYINIPIYTVAEGGLKLPVSLSYHAGGVKVMEPAGWVGTGWALNAGGVISRTVRGAPDERNNSNAVKGHFSDYGFSKYLTFGGDQPCYGSGVDNNEHDFAAGYLDGEPDLFSFNFNGYSGKFYFNDDRKAIIVDGQDVKVDVYYPADTATSYTAVSANIQGFILTVPTGDKYYFGINPGANLSGADPVEITWAYSASHQVITDRIFSSWYLSKIVSADNQFAISLTYTSEKYSFFTLSMFPVDGESIDPSEVGYELTKEYIDGVRLNQIVFSNGTVLFNPSSTARTDLSNDIASAGNGYIADDPNTQAKSLSSIEINNGSGFCKKFKLYYSYFTDNTNALQGALSGASIQSDKYRLKLDSLSEISCDSSIFLPPYKFTYNGNFLPRRLLFAQDHWGFYNGATSNTGLIPTYTEDQFFVKTGANRDSHWPEMSYGTLTTIQYPTGGSTQIIFESNNVWVSYSYYNHSFVTSAGIGPGIGQNSNQMVNFTSTANPYKLTLDFHTSQSYNSQASVSFGSLTVDKNNPHAETVIQPGSGSQSIPLTMSSNMQANDYATCAVFQEIPSSFEGNQTVGGLRVKKITTNDSVTNKQMVTNYEYEVSSNHSSGILYSRPTYVRVVRNDGISLFGLAPACMTNTNTNLNPNGCYAPDVTPAANTFYYKSPAPIVPMTNTQGNHIGYNQVKIYQTGNGYSIYQYYGSNYWDNIISDVAIRNVNRNQCLLSIPSMPAIPEPYEYNRGELKYEAHYTENAQLLKSIYYYMTYDSTSPTPAHNVKFVVGFSQLDNDYTVRGYWKKQIQTISYENDLKGHTDTTKKTTYFESAYHHQPTREESINSTGDTIAVKYKYAIDFRVAACDALPDSLSYYNSACSTCDATMNATINSCSSIACKWRAWVVNSQCKAQARVNYINSRKNYFAAFKTTHDNAKTNADSELKPILELQDGYQNPVIETSTWKRNQLSGAIFNRFDYSGSNVYINKTKLINVASLSSTFTQATTTTTSVTKDSRYKDESSYSFAAGNLAQTIPRNGVSESYIWDYYKVNPIAKITNAGSEKFAYTSFEADGKGNWTFSGSTSAHYSAPTGSKGYSLSGGNITKSSLSSNVTYIITYWKRDSSSTVTVNSGSGTLSATRNGWKLYQHEVTGTTSVTISGTAFIDELRLYPKGSLMSTYTYCPLKGISTQCDANNRITYYEYDALGRLYLVKDQDRNIIKKICYNYAGQVEDCDCLIRTANWQDITNSVMCEQSGGVNTGYRLQQQRDMNTCSPTYNQTRWVSTYNISACPVCNYTNCSGEGYKCVYGQCELGVKVYSNTWYDESFGWWVCAYHYEYSDGSWSADYEEHNSTPCYGN